MFLVTVQTYIYTQPSLLATPMQSNTTASRFIESINDHFLLRDVERI